MIQTFLLSSIFPLFIANSLSNCYFNKRQTSSSEIFNTLIIHCQELENLDIWIQRRVSVKMFESLCKICSV